MPQILNPDNNAGVPVTRPVAGVAMGLMLEEGGQFRILTDILGSEDAMGDMDFKVAGDADAITAFQMDIKVRPAVRSGRDASRMHHADAGLLTWLALWLPELSGSEHSVR